MPVLFRNACIATTRLRETQHDLPVASIVVLLNPRASHLSEVTGVYERVHPHTGLYVTFRYHVLRVWEIPVETLLTGGLATLPLALLTDMANSEPRQVVETVCERLLAESADEEQAELLLTASYLLGGLRFPDTMITSLFEGMINMLEESSTYQALIQRGLSRGIAQGLEQGRELGLEQGREQGREEGVVEGARRLLRRAGEKRLGVPNVDAQTRIDGIASVEQIEYFMDRLFFVETWDDLLAS